MLVALQWGRAVFSRTPHLLVNAYVTREAVASSHIEGTQASVTEVFDSVVTGESGRGDIREVRNYISALRHGPQRLDDDFPISLRLIREMHALLLSDVRDQPQLPPHPLRPVALSIRDDSSVPGQQWTIRPLIYHLLSRTTGSTAQALLYLSSYFDQHKNDYYDRLQYVRERGEIVEWLNFFLRGIALQAVDAVDRAELLIDLREKYRHTLKGNRSRAPEVVDLLFANPVLTVRYVQQKLDISQPGATNLLRALTELGIVREIRRGPGVRHRWFADDVLAVLEPDGAGNT